MSRVLIVACAMCLGACGARDSFGGDGHTLGWVHDGPAAAAPSRGAFSIRWSHQLTPRADSNYVPVEYAEPAFDPRRSRIYVGATDGRFRAFDINGKPIFKYDAKSAIEAAPVVDRRSGEIFVVSMDGMVHALNPHGAAKWTALAAVATRRAPVLSADAVYIVSDEDRVVALSRQDGTTLWGYDEERIEEMTIAGHAGLVLAGNKLLTAFNSGRVAAIDPLDGTVDWAFDSSTDIELSQSDIPQFFDVDTTPVVVGDTVYVASFTGGLYAIDLDTGSLEWREDQLVGITALVATQDGALLAASARRGLFLFNVDTRTETWSRPNERGAPTKPALTKFGTAVFGETKGSLIAVALEDGREIGRAEGGYGFSAAPSVASEVGAALSNGGRLLCLRLN